MQLLRFCSKISDTNDTNNLSELTMKNKKLDVIVDLQFGSTGKGAIAGFLSSVHGYEAVVTTNMPNSGHTAYAPDGTKFIHKVLPSGIFSEKLKIIAIGPGSVFSVDRLVEELDGLAKYFDDDRQSKIWILIHEAAGVLLPEHKDTESKSLSGISSTMQGSGAALCDKIMRKPHATIKNSPERARLMKELDKRNHILFPLDILDQSQWLEELGNCDSILLEGSQGYSLGVSAGFYPFCTSRDCTPARVISDANLPLSWLRHVYGSARTYPIRVGNTPDGYSGDWYKGQKEVTFESIGQEPELTTVTGRVRRIATFSMLQMKEAMQMAHPTYVFLNFCNYMKNEEDIESLVLSINGLASDIGCGGVGFAGYGPKPQDITDMRVGSIDKIDRSTIDAMTKEVVNWVQNHLPDEKRNPVNACIKAIQELGELQHAIYTGDGNVGEECADVMAVLLDIIYLTRTNIAKEFYDKMRINKCRKWAVVNGALKHIRDGK